jgi:transposase
MMTVTHQQTQRAHQHMLERAVEDRCVIGGADTHADTVHIAAIDQVGRPLGDREFATTPAGYRAALAFLGEHGTLSEVGVEGSSSYGVGFTAVLQDNGILVREVSHPDRSQRRRQGKSDPIDAYQAARAVLDGRAGTLAKTQQIEPLRALLNARKSAVKAATAAMNQIHQMLVNAPAALREKYRQLKESALIRALSSSRPGVARSDHRPHLFALKVLAQRHQFLHDQADILQAEIRTMVAEANPALLAAYGIGPITAAQLLITAGDNPERLHGEASFAALCGTAPVPASSGRTTRHRLSRGGDRAANAALHTIATVRIGSDRRTQAFVARHRDKGRSSLEILRLLKRAIAREAFHLLTRPGPAPDISDLRPTRRARHVSLEHAAAAVGSNATSLSRIERGRSHNIELIDRYRQWLTTV